MGSRFAFELGGTGLVNINRPVDTNSDKILERASKSFGVNISEYVESSVTYRPHKVETVMYGILYMDKRTAITESSQSQDIVNFIDKYIGMRDNETLLHLSFPYSVTRCNADIHNIIASLADKRMMSTMCPVNVDYIAITTHDKMELNIKDHMDPRKYMFVDTGDGTYISRVM